MNKPGGQFLNWLGSNIIIIANGTNWHLMTPDVIHAKGTVSPQLFLPKNAWSESYHEEISDDPTEGHPTKQLVCNPKNGSQGHEEKDWEITLIKGDWEAGQPDTMQGPRPAPWVWGQKNMIRTDEKLWVLKITELFGH